jgi:hypothetical protein
MSQDLSGEFKEKKNYFPISGNELMFFYRQTRTILFHSTDDGMMMMMMLIMILIVTKYKNLITCPLYI